MQVDGEGDSDGKLQTSYSQKGDEEEEREEDTVVVDDGEGSEEEEREEDTVVISTEKYQQHFWSLVSMTQTISLDSSQTGFENIRGTTWLVA